MSTPAEAMQRLDGLAFELGDLSQRLADVERRLEPVSEEYQKFVDDHDIGMYQRSIDETGFKLPSAEMRLKLANRSMPLELYGQYTALIHSRARLIKRISDIKVQVDAQRSILSAMKSELEATTR